MKLGIIGTRGIPNHYGGFEQFAERLSVDLVKRGHTVTVYNVHHHPYREKTYEGVNIRHGYDATKILGTSGQFIYDLNCIRNARKQQFDVLLFLGYTSSSVWGWLYPQKTVIACNMDGLEWKREKYGSLAKRFLRYAEKLAIRYSQHLIADCMPIKKYLWEKYKKDSTCIAYGADIPGRADDAVYKEYGITPGEYYLIIARMEPENNIKTILEGFRDTRSEKKMVVIGHVENRVGRNLKKSFGTDSRIRFLGMIFNKPVLDAIRAGADTYFHGHSVGGTNPSLLEAMAAKCFIVAHENIFNRAVLHGDAVYFESKDDIRQILENPVGPAEKNQFVVNNLTRINEEYNWERIIDQYETFLKSALAAKK
jgi:glycosyltransferase involved in cell wall biosynthesis